MSDEAEHPRRLRSIEREKTQALGLGEGPTVRVGVDTAELRASFVLGREERYVVLRSIGVGGMGRVYLVYDRVLDRRVAMKDVGLVDDDGGAKFIAEARALAKVSHPNVVGIYDVLTEGARAYLFMEYIEGGDLRKWLAGSRKSVKDVAQMFLGIGRGLSAIHRLGMIHCDLKPENVLVDEAGCPKVADFGVVRALGDRCGTIAGTPSYMAPEQLVGAQVLTSGVDVFAYSVCLYESLFGKRPFEGTTINELRRAVMRGVVFPQNDHGVPRRLLRVIHRGLACDPADRWPSVDELMDPLAHSPWRSRLPIVSTVGALALGGLLSQAATWTYGTSPDTCEEGAGRVAEIWSAEREAAVSASFRATGVPFAADVFARVEARLGDYSQELAEAQRVLCKNERAGSVTGRVSELRSLCLSHRRSRLSKLTEHFLNADQGTVENAIQAVAALPSVEGCQDDERLLSARLLPEDPAMADVVSSLRDDLERVESMESVGRYDDGLTLIRRIRADEVLTAFAPLKAEVALREGSLLVTSGRAEEAVEALYLALRVAIVEDLDEVAAEAASRLLFATGEGLGRPSSALATAPYAEALVARAPGERRRIEALLANNLGSILDLSGDYEEATIQYQRSIEIMEATGRSIDPLVGSTYHNLGGMYLDRGEPSEAARYFGKAYEVLVSIFGDSHPLVAHPLVGLGEVAIERGEREQASAFYSRSVELMEEGYGPEHVYLIDGLVGLGNIHVADDPATAERLFRRVEAICETKGASCHPALGAAWEGLGTIALARGRASDAGALFERAAAIYGSSRGRTDRDIARVALKAGKAAIFRGDRESAIASLERVLAASPTPHNYEFRMEALIRLAGELLHERPREPRWSERACELLSEAEELGDGSAPAEVSRMRARACEHPP